MSGGAAAGTVLEIPAGAVHRLDPETTVLHLDRLVMGRDSVLRIPPGERPVTLQARQAVLHAGSLIDARGLSGQPGRDGVDAAGATPACEDGQSGTPGTAGTPGGPGRDLVVTLGIATFESLTIDTGGGAGGSGGHGGRGADGGAVDGCHAGDGGDGAPGGAGGTGGAGGDIQLRFWVTQPGVRVPITNYGEGITLRSAGGPAGAQGVGGSGGEGGRARYEKRSIGKTIAREAGDDGASGQPGGAGRDGAAGRTRLEVVAPQSIGAGNE